ARAALVSPKTQISNPNSQGVQTEHLGSWCFWVPSLRHSGGPECRLASGGPESGYSRLSREAFLAFTEWTMQGTEVVNCSCEYGCPCQFSRLPTHDYCKAV